jgi:hypothetical protein
MMVWLKACAKAQTIGGGSLRMGLQFVDFLGPCFVGASSEKEKCRYGLTSRGELFL